VNLSWLLFKTGLSVGVVSLLALSQVFWYRALWRLTARWGSRNWRILVRLVVLVLAAVSVLAMVDTARMGRANLIPHVRFLPPFIGLWFLCALFAYLAVMGVRVFDRVWQFVKGRRGAPAETFLPSPDAPADPSRRYFFKTASAAAGAAPFLGAMYGFAAERLNYQVRRVEIPVSNLPAALEGLKITQLSDIHLSGYMPREQVRRAIQMANELEGDLAVVTGDFITGAGDSLEDCVEELRGLVSPLGVFGCNGNHEIYADAEGRAQFLFAQAGMKLLRRESAVPRRIPNSRRRLVTAYATTA